MRAQSTIAFVYIMIIAHRLKLQFTNFFLIKQRTHTGVGFIGAHVSFNCNN